MAISTISLGKVKFNWTGAWTPSTNYDKDDVFKYGPNVYTVTDGHTSGTTFAENLASVDLMVAGIENAGTWNDSTLYKAGQVITYGGAVYIALRENTAANPYTAANDWQKFVDGQQFEGDWSAANNYQKGDIVYYGGYLYVAVQNTQANNPTDSLFWAIFSKGFIFVGEWSSSQQYKPGEVVSFGGNRYVCNENLRPLANLPTDIIYWTKILDGFTWKGDFFKGDDDNLPTEYKPGDIVKFGAKLYAAVGVTQGINPDSDSNFELFLDGLRWQGEWSEFNDYTTGDVVRLGGRAYICIETYENDGSTTPEPPNPTYWELLIDGFKWNGTYDPAIQYEIGDVVEYAQSSYISVSSDNQGNQPDTDDGSNWNLIAQGDSNAVIAQRGDLLVRGAVQADRLPIGPAGSVLYSDGTDVRWGHQSPLTEYYVSLEGDDSNDGRTATTSWRTIEYACQQTFNLGQCKINIAAGTYDELCPMRVGRSVVIEGNGLGAVTISPDNINDKGYGAGISKDGSTPNANSDIFQLNNGCRLRNIVFRGFSTGAVCTALDPGTGPDDTSVWITSQSPYIQNCTSFTPEGTGMLVDGSLHNGGYKSMVANDWTQLNSDGIGIHVKSDARVELVSVFTYYCRIGYLAESGAKIRALVGNNSYGDFGAVARGFSQAETPLAGRLQLNDDIISSVQVFEDDIHIFTSYRDFQGNIYGVGHTAPTGLDNTSTYDNTASYPIIIKLNNAGSLDWIYSYESNFGAVHNIIEINDSLYATGLLYDGTEKAFVIKISRNGEFQWQKTLGDVSEITDATTDGTNLYVIGKHVSSGVSVTRLTPAGLETWSRTFGDSDWIATSCTYGGTPTTSEDSYEASGDATAENNLYIAVKDPGESKSYVIRLSNVGAYVDAYDYGDVNINSIKLDTGNGDGIYLVACGWYDASPDAARRPIIFRLSLTGEVQWQEQCYLGSEEGEFKEVLPFGNDIYAVGYMNTGTNTNNTGMVARYNSNGSSQWIQYVTNNINNVVLNGVSLDGVNVIAGGIDQNDSLLINIQRDGTGNFGTVTSGNYNVGVLATFEDQNTIVTKADLADPTINQVTLGLVDSNLTLNQSSGITRTIAATRAGFAGIGTGINFAVSGLARKPKEGSVVHITGDDETYFCIGVNNFKENFGVDQDNNPNSVDALTSNKNWIQQETIGWITDQIANATPGSIWENFTYDQVDYSDKFGNIVDALISDIDSSTLGSFEQNDSTIDVALTYWSGIYSQVQGEQNQIIAAISYLKGLVVNALDKSSPANTYSGVTQETGHATVELGIDIFTNNRVDIITDVIANGPDAAPSVLASGSCEIALEPAIPSNKTPDDDTALVFREAFSQVRMTGHDFLDIGTGGFADTNYPVIIQEDYVQAPDQARETDSADGGRVFYVTTDQDGNFRVGDYFKVEQATGRATLSSEEFDLSGLNELQLGSITAGRAGATINEFSTDGTFADNSDTAVPTERAVVTYVTNKTSELSESLGTIQVGADPNKTKVEVVGSGAQTDTVEFDVFGQNVSEIGLQHIRVPAGSTADRPSSPTAGMIRYNTDLSSFEGYNGSQWSGIGGGNPWITQDTAYTATNGDRIFADTSSGSFTITLPATPAVGDSVRIKDLAGTFATNPLTVDNNGNLIDGQNDTLLVDLHDAGFEVVYSGATYGWKLLEV